MKPDTTNPITRKSVVATAEFLVHCRIDAALKKIKDELFPEDEIRELAEKIVGLFDEQAEDS